MRTTYLLMAEQDGKIFIPIEVLCRDYFKHLSPLKFSRKVASGDIKLPLMQIEPSNKSAKGVDVRDLAIYLDERRAEAHKDCDRLHC